MKGCSGNEGRVREMGEKTGACKKKFRGANTFEAGTGRMMTAKSGAGGGLVTGIRSASGEVGTVMVEPVTSTLRAASQCRRTVSSCSPVMKNWPAPLVLGTGGVGQASFRAFWRGCVVSRG